MRLVESMGSRTGEGRRARSEPRPRAMKILAAGVPFIGTSDGEKRATHGSPEALCRAAIAGALAGRRLRRATPPASLPPPPFQQPIRFLVDPLARADRDDFNDIPCHSINDPEGSHPEAAQAGKLAFQCLPRRGIGENRLKRRPGLPFQGRMHAADKISDLVRYPEPVERRFHDGSLSE